MFSTPITTMSRTSRDVDVVTDAPRMKKKRKLVDYETIVKKMKSSSVSLEEEKIYEMSSSANTNGGDFKNKYCQIDELCKGGFGVVFAGVRKPDWSPVAIKYIPLTKVKWGNVTCNGKEFNVILEVALMLKAAGIPGSVGKSTVVSLLDWYILDQQLILVMERPLGCMDLLQYVASHGGTLAEHEAKVILKQLVDAAIDMQSKNIFHRDIKPENVLVQIVSGQLRVRVIDFGCGSFSSEMPYHSICGTLEYSPPEWFSIQTYWAHPTTVWQLGAVFYSMLIGDFSTTHFIKRKNRMTSSLSREAKSLLKMCLDKNPYKRATLRELQIHPTFIQLSHRPNEKSTEED